MPFPLLEPFNFHDVFQPFYDMIHQAQQAMDAHLQRTPYHFPRWNSQKTTTVLCVRRSATTPRDACG